MSDIKVATRYAKSLLEEAVKNKLEENIKVDIDLFMDTMDNNRELRVVMNNPIVTFDKKFEILNKIFSDKIQKLTLDFFHIVCKKGRSIHLIEIAREYVNQFYAFKNINRASLSTAIAIDESLKKEFIQLLEEGFGKKVELRDVVDDSLIGGFILRMNDRQIDESIKHKLNLLKLNLIEKSYNPII